MGSRQQYPRQYVSKLVPSHPTLVLMMIVATSVADSVVSVRGYQKTEMKDYH